MVFEALGLDPHTESVYRLLLAEPSWGVSRVAQALGLSEAEVHKALENLLELTLLRPAEGGRLHPIRPEVGLMKLLTHSHNELLRRQQQLHDARAAISVLSAQHPLPQADDRGVFRLDSLDAVRDRLEQLAASAEDECLSLMRGGALAPDAIQAGRHPNQVALERGVKIRSVFQDSYRNDPQTLRYARWLAELGGLTRTTPIQPSRLVIADRSIALVPIDPADGRKGALELHDPALVQPLCALFEQVWEHATPFDAPRSPDRSACTPSESALLRLLDQGLTDDAAARKLGISLRSARRMFDAINSKLEVHSRFQTGAAAARNGWI